MVDENLPVGAELELFPEDEPLDSSSGNGSD